MLIVRAPVRISFMGGGTDMPSYYEEHGGVVISTSINKYFYVFLNDLGVGDSQLISADYKSIFSVAHDDTLDDNPTDSGLMWGGDNDLVLPKAILSHFRHKRGENIFISCEVPPGTGLGSSSAAAVGLITALAHKRGINLSKAQIAELACYIEMEKLQMPIGKQDQYAAAFGGLNQLTFSAGKVTVEPLNVSDAARKTLEERLMLFFTGVSRQSTTILRDQQASVQRDEKAVIQNLHYLKELTAQTRKCFERGNLDESWQRKKQLSPHIANSSINEVYEAARTAGAAGGKITGAGGGGFLLLYCLPQHQSSVTRALAAYGLKKMSFGFDTLGSHVLLDKL